MVTCEFCNNTLKNIEVLKIHQQKDKHCLKKRLQKLGGIYECRYCEFSTKIQDELKIHICEDKIYKEKNDYYYDDSWLIGCEMK